MVQRQNFAREPPLTDEEERTLALVLPSATFAQHRSQWTAAHFLRRRDFVNAGVPVPPEENFGLDWPLLLGLGLLILWGPGTCATNCWPELIYFARSLFRRLLRRLLLLAAVEWKAAPAVMAPKTLPSPRPDPHQDAMPGSQYTFWDAAPVNFRPLLDFSRAFDDAAGGATFPFVAGGCRLSAYVAGGTGTRHAEGAASAGSYFVSGQGTP
eukprot:s3519_g3.t1